MATTLYDLISIKLQLGDETRRLKLPLKDLTPSTLPGKLRAALNIPASKNVVFERYSDSAGAYITLDPSNQPVYKQLYRAAKAKAKLRIKVLVTENEEKKIVPVEHISEEREIPTTKAPSAMSSQTAFSIPIQVASKTTLPLPVKKEESPAVTTPWKSWTGHVCSFTVQCNNCGDTIPDTHYHCDICDNNDFDLCSKCVESGIHCDVDEHFLIKRTVVDGKISNSTTYKFQKKVPREEKEMPGAFQSEIREPVQVEATRTCNSCVTSYTENKFITCLDCEDYDLCEKCFVGGKHGHHPAHGFKPVDEKSVSGLTMNKVKSGGIRHFATCDGCDKNIFGVRHKCLNCPDFDFCSECALSARHIHPGHRFAQIYDHIGLENGYKPLHNFIRCDGPLCKSKQSYIRGDRYKCAVCPDTDFCANCEAYPVNNHCKNHPLIKLRTPVRNVSVTTFGEDKNGEIMSTMGDKPPQKISKSTETTSSKSANAATQVQTIAEIKPASPKVEPTVVSEEKTVAEPQVPISTTPKPQLQAWYVSDTLVDNTKVQPNQLYTQTWTLRNPGPLAWPTGCTVRYTGGDNMLNLSTEHPSSKQDIEAAVSSNTISSEVQEGQEVQFSITVRAPKTPGRAISYWRLKTPEGTPFGHKLWCDVFVMDKLPQIQEPVKVESVKEEKPVEKLDDTKLEASQMVFPTLEKESPASSILVDTAPKVESIAGDEVEFIDDLEQLALSDADDDSEDAFLTDEEYEMLDTDSAFEEAINGKK